MKAFVLTLITTCTLCCSIDPYRTLGLSPHLSDHQLIESTKEILLQYGNDGFANDIMIEAFEEIMEARGKSVKGFVNALKLRNREMTEMEKLKHKGKPTKSCHLTQRIVEVFRSILAREMGRSALLDQQVQLENLFSFGTLLWMAKVLINNTLIMFLVFLLGCKCYQLQTRQTKRYR